MEKTEGIVIRLADFSETSHVVTFFTRDWGKISALAKGSRRLKSSFESAIDLLTVCHIVFIRKSGGSLDILTESNLSYRFHPHARELRSLYAGYYVAELLAGLTEEYDPHPQLFDEAVETLKSLQNGQDLPKAVVRFELVLLGEIGQMPQFDQCVICGQQLAAQPTYIFRASQGGMVCSTCRREEFGGQQLQAGTVALLRRLANESPALLEHTVLSPGQVKEIRQVMQTEIAQAMGRRPKMWSFLQGM